MPRLALQPQGSPDALMLDVEWTAASDDLAGFTLTLKGETLTGHGSIGPNGAGVLRIGSHVRPFYVSRSAGVLHLWLDGETYTFTLPSASQTGRPRAQALPASGEVRSPMPGMILKVPVQPGDAVTAQAPLVVIESMKMELTVPAPANGKVAEILCQPGQRVERDAVLLRLEVQQDEGADGIGD